MRESGRTRQLAGERIRFALASGLAWSAVFACRSAPIERDSDDDAGSGGHEAVFYPSGSGPVGGGGQGGGVSGGHAGTGGGVSVESRPPPTAPAGAPEWMYDASAWTPVETLPECITRVARDPRAIYPGHEFASCGDGCRRADVIPGSPGLATLLGTSARVVDGELRIALTAHIESDRTAYVMGTFGFGDGKPDVLIAEDGACIGMAAGRGSLSTFRVMTRSGEFRYRIGWIDPSIDELTWLSPPANWLFDGFDYGSGWGGLDIYSHGELFVAPDPRLAEVTSLYVTPGVMFYPFSSNGVVTVTEFANEGRVLLWRPGGEVRPAAAGPWRAARVGLSSERLAWLAVTGERASEGLYETATVYSCALPNANEMCAVEEGPTLPIVGSSSVLSVQGRWIALIGCSESECDAYLVDWQRKATYRVRRIANDHGIEVIGLSDTELFVADFSPQARGTPYFDGIIRYDLARLDDFAARL